MQPWSDFQSPSVDTELLSSFIYELAIARRHVVAYPANHPVIDSTLGKVINLLDELILVSGELTLGVVKDALLVGDSFLDQSNPAHRHLATLLASHGIAALTITNNLTKEELLAFLQSLSVKRELVDERGGLPELMKQAGISSLQVRLIDYQAFRAAEDEEAVAESGKLPSRSAGPPLWESFVRALLEGNLAEEWRELPKGPDDLEFPQDPAAVADILNRRIQQYSISRGTAKSYSHSICNFLRQIDLCSGETIREAQLRSLGSLISGLSPELRRQFLTSSFGYLATHQELADRFLAGIPEEIIVDTLKELNARKAKLPQFMLELIGKLSSLYPGHGGQPGAKVDPAEKLRVLFQEEQLDKFVPETYQKALRSIVSGELSPADDLLEIEELKHTLSENFIEEQLSSVVLDIFDSDSGDEDCAMLQQNLADICGYFLALGDFAALVKIYDRVKRRAAALPDQVRDDALKTFAKMEFTEEVLNGLNLWGKAKYKDIGILIDRVADPFVQSLFERLATDQNMSLRRYYMERLQQIGEAAKSGAIKRLSDKRWFFVRNLVFLLRNLGDPAVVPHIRRLMSHPHPKVRQEALRTLLEFNDPDADRLLVRDLESPDHETRMAAIRLAEHCRGQGVVSRLLQVLNAGGITNPEVEMKAAVLHSLAMIGDPAALPGVERLLASRSLLRPGQLRRLKLAALHSLKQYPREYAVPLLEKLAQSGQRELQKAAMNELANWAGRAT